MHEIEKKKRNTNKNSKQFYFALFVRDQVFDKETKLLQYNFLDLIFLYSKTLNEFVFIELIMNM